jgi:hypothetical protein
MRQSKRLEPGRATEKNATERHKSRLLADKTFNNMIPFKAGAG